MKLQLMEHTAKQLQPDTVIEVQDDNGNNFSVTIVERLGAGYYKMKVDGNVFTTPLVRSNKTNKRSVKRLIKFDDSIHDEIGGEAYLKSDLTNKLGKVRKAIEVKKDSVQADYDIANSPAFNSAYIGHIKDLK